MECSICGAEIKKGMLEKIKGTYIKKGGKLHPICSDCQKKGEDDAREKLK